MNFTTVMLFFSLLLNFLVIYLVYKSNPNRLPNRIFFFPGANIGLWGFNYLFIINATTVEMAETWIRAAFAVGSFVPVTFLMMVYSIGEKKFSVLKKKGFLLISLLAVVNFFFCFTPSLFTSVTKPVRTMQQVPDVTFGWPFLVYFVFFFVSIGYDVAVLFKKLKRSKGIARAELQYILLGWFFAGLVVFFCNFLYPVVFKSALLVQFSPVGVFIINGFIGYGIARYKILDVSVVMQKLLSYSLVILSIFLLYTLSVGSFNWMFVRYITAGSLLAETSALLVVIFAFEPIRKRINEFVSRRIFKLEYSTENLLAGLEKVLYTVGDVKVFLQKCLRIVLESVGIASGRVFFVKPGEQKLYFSISQSLNENDDIGEPAYPEAMEKLIGKTQAPLIKGEIERRIPSDENTAVINEMEEIKAEMAIPLVSERKLFGILCFGEKVSGKFYTPQDEEVFERLSHYLSLKVQNFLFYEQLEKVRIYQETLLENLPIGVIGTDANGDVTVVNKEAERITGLDRKCTERRHFNETLPEELRKILAYSIDTRKGLRHLRFRMKKDGSEISLNANSSVFSDGTGNLAGVQVIFSDVTHIEELEEGIQRAEKFASLGIMAAGIAHEIKNPLVSIQTFANLLPEKYNDREFREMFSALTIKEVQRINALVEQILVFAKPRSPVFTDVDIIDVLKATVLLLSGQFPEKKIVMRENYCSDRVILKGDEGKLKQAFLNVLINSAQSLGREGTIKVNVQDNGKGVTVKIEDDGCGIKQDAMDKIFEPFFTTKEKGTGLGLSIVTRIVDEHRGSIKVDSVEGKGTSVSIELPLHGDGEDLNELYTLDSGK